MDKFVTVIKPSASRLQALKQDQQEDKRAQQSTLRYNPYGKKPIERGPKDWKEKKRVEK